MNSRDINKTFSQFNKNMNQIDKELKQLKKENQQKTDNSTLEVLSAMSETMQKRGANEKSIQLAILGTYEFFKVTSNARLDKSSIDRLASSENKTQQNTASYGIPLSEITTQQLTWLWDKRIPQGKITALEGDPGMSKSLLAIDIAAHISTGRPLPGDSTGKNGNVILIAPEDGAADTIKPRVEAAAGDLSKVHLLNTVESLDVKDLKNINFYQRPFSLSRNLFELERTIKQTKAMLVV